MASLQDVNKALQADPKFQELLRQYHEIIARNNTMGQAPVDGTAVTQAMTDYAENYARAHGVNPQPQGVGDRVHLDTKTGQFTDVHDPNGAGDSWQEWLPVVTAGVGGALLSGAGGVSDLADVGADVGGIGGTETTTLGAANPEIWGAGGAAAADASAAGAPIAGAAGTAAEAAAGTGTAGLAGKALTGLSTLGKIGGLLGGAANAVGAAGQAEGNNALDQEKLALQANRDNISGMTAYEQALMGRAHEEDAQRKTALKNVYMDSYAHNPNVSPFNTTGGPHYSQQYLQTIGDLSRQGGQKLSTPGQYDTNGMPVLNSYNPIDPRNVQGATNTKPGAINQVGNWLSPTLSIAGKIFDWAGK